MSAKKPKKPSLSIGELIFSKDGKVKRVVEYPPDVKEGIEQLIVEKFINRLKELTGRKFTSLKKADPWPDFECLEDNKLIRIELAEIINERYMITIKIQKDYEKYIKEEINDIVKELSGLEISLFDNYQEPPYPQISTNDGKKLAQSFVNQIRSNLKDFIELPINKIKQYCWQKGPHVPYASFSVIRKSPKDQGKPLVLGFYEGIYLCSEDKIEEYLLKDIINKKIDKNYPIYSKGKLILLTYEIAIMYSLIFPKSIELAKCLLKNKNHPFDEVWYFFPYAERNSGDCKKIWPI